jgi:hypothetical protein
MVDHTQFAPGRVAPMLHRLLRIVALLLIPTAMIASVVLAAIAFNQVAATRTEYRNVARLGLPRLIDSVDYQTLSDERDVERYVLTGDPELANRIPDVTNSPDIEGWTRTADDYLLTYIGEPIGESLRSEDTKFWQETKAITERIRAGDQTAVGAKAFDSMESPYQRSILLVEMKSDLIDRERAAFGRFDAANKRLRYALGLMSFSRSI